MMKRRRPLLSGGRNKARTAKSKLRRYNDSVKLNLNLIMIPVHELFSLTVVLVDHVWSLVEVILLCEPKHYGRVGATFRIAPSILLSL